MTNGDSGSRDSLYRQLFEESADGIFLADSAGNLVEVNPRAQELTGYSRDELLSLDLSRIIHPEDLARDPLVLQAHPVGRVGMKERKILRKDGSVFLGETSFRRLPDGHLLGILRDIPGRMVIEEALRESELRLREIVEETDDLITRVDPEGRFYFLNNRAAEIFGLPVKECLGRLAFDFVHPDDREATQRWFTQCVAERVTKARFENRQVSQNGRVWHLLWTATFHYHPSGSLRTVSSIASDITELKRVEVDKWKLLNILDASLNEIYLFDSQTLRFEYVSKGALANLGFTMEEMRARTPLDIKPEFTASQFRTMVAPLLAGTLKVHVFQTMHQRADRTLYPVEVHLQVIPTGVSRCFLAMIHDISDRKRMEQQISEALRFNQLIFEASPVGILTYRESGQCISVNPAATRVTGGTMIQLLGQNFRKLESWKKSGLLALAEEALRTGKPVRGEVQITTTFGRETWYELQASPFDFGGEKHLLLLIDDLADRKRAEAEKRRLQEQLAQSQKMESVGRLAGGVAHDFNNMLCVILGITDQALERSGPAHPFHADLQEIRKAAQRSADLTRQLLAFARKQTISPIVLNLNETVGGMLKMLRRLIGENIDLIWVPGPDPWQVKIDPSQVDQVLANLCVNARSAIEGVGKITIETRNMVVDEASQALNAEAVPGEYVVLTVSDTGVGMTKDVLEHLFEPFFTTRRTGEGTGLGLATVYGAVKQNHGFINVYSEPGKGTTFKIHLPRWVGKNGAGWTEPHSGNGPILRGRETILLVEDEPGILALGKAILEKLGYRVMAAISPGEAIRQARENPGEIHLLITDVVMPEMNGQELANKLLALYPNLRRLFMSGYTADVIAHQGILEEDVPFLQKPFSTKELAAKVRAVLDGE